MYYSLKLFTTVVLLFSELLYADGKTQDPPTKVWVRKRINKNKRYCDGEIEKLERENVQIKATMAGFMSKNDDLQAQLEELVKKVSGIEKTCCPGTSPPTFTKVTKAPTAITEAPTTAKCVEAELAPIQPDEAFDGFGSSIAIYGDTMIVGSEDSDNNFGQNSGVVFIYSRSGPGIWEQVDKLMASDGSKYDDFGGSVDIFGDTIVIGMNNAFAPGGFIYIFTLQDGNWVQTQKLPPNDSYKEEDLFGQYVAISEDTIVVTSKWNPENDYRSGAVYIFNRDGSKEWYQKQKLLPSDSDISDNFGSCIAIDGDTIVVGSYNDDDKGADSGSAYVFTRDNGQWSQFQKLVPSDGAANDWFGGTAAVSGGTIVIGNQFDDDKGDASGSVLIFTKKNNGRFKETQKLVANDGQPRDYHGRHVAISGDNIGDKLFVGTYGDDENKGSVYVYILDESKTWVSYEKLVAPEGQPSDFFGGMTEISGNNLVISATGKNSFKGSIYVAEIC